MITELEIKGFKVLRECKLDGLTRLTLVGGKNNSGKTTLLEGFFLSQDWANPTAIVRHLGWRGVEAWELSTASWLPAFTDLQKGAKIDIASRTADGDRYIYTVQMLDEQPRAAKSQPRADATETQPTSEAKLRVLVTKKSKPIFEASISIEGNPPVLSQNQKFQSLETPPIASFVSSRLRPTATDDATRYGRLDQEKRAESVVEQLKIIEPKLVGLSVVALGDKSQIYADVKGLPRKVPASLLGDGFSRLLSYLLIVNTNRGGYILVDEIESGFHHSVLNSVWKTLYESCRATKCQLIATTHSYECVVAYTKAFRELGLSSDAGRVQEFSYFRIDKKDQKSDIVRYGLDQLETAAEAGWDVR